VPQRFTMGNTCLGWTRILKLFWERGKEEEVKKTKKAEKNAEKNAENNGLLKKRSIFWIIKGTCLGKGHEVTLLSMLIMSHTPKNIS
jgi:hypothetical protein